MFGRAHDGIAFPAVLLALASLGTPASQVNAAETTVADSSREVPSDEVSSGAVSSGPALPGRALPADVPSGDAEPLATVPRGAEAETAEAEAAEGADEGADMVLWTMVDTVTLDATRLRNLRGDFVARLERVAERMWNDHGMRVEIVEGYRTPERQQRLFAQGRTAEGPVVTWTRNSLHSAGAAADLLVDGSPVTPEQAVLLSRVAREEGLRTLHPFDSGHIQLEGVARRGAPESLLPREQPATLPGPPQARGVAPVAPVAQPARPARPGGVVMLDAEAVVPQPGGRVRPEGGPPRSEGGPASPEVGRPGGLGGVGAGKSGPSALEEAQRSLAAALRTTQPASRGAVEGAAGTSARVADANTSDARPDAREVRGAVGTGGTTGSTPDSSAGPGPAANAASGAAAAQPAPDGGGSSPVRDLPTSPVVPTMEPSGHMTRLEGSNGSVYRRLHLPIDGLAGPASLQLGVRGGTVDASLTVSDPILATDLRQNLQELRHALASRGIETGGLAIRVAGEAGGKGAATGAEVTAHAAVETGGTSATSDTRSGDSRQHGSRNTDPRFTDDHDDEAMSRGRDRRPRRNAQEE